MSTTIGNTTRKILKAVGTAGDVVTVNLGSLLSVSQMNYLQLHHDHVQSLVSMYKITEKQAIEKLQSAGL